MDHEYRRIKDYWRNNCKNRNTYEEFYKFMETFEISGNTIHIFFEDYIIYQMIILLVV